MVARRPYPSIPQPTLDPKSLQETVLSLKEAVELLTRQRGDKLDSMPSWRELVTLEVIAEDQVPGR